MFKKMKTVAKLGKKSGMFLGGLVFGTVGLKLLASKEAKKGYAYVVAKGMKVKGELDSVVSNVKQHSDDVYAEAQDIYQEELLKDSFEILDDGTDKNEETSAKL